MSELADFLTARVADDEAIVRGAAAHHEPHRDLWISDWPPGGQLGISRARMRVEIEAKRRLLTRAIDRNDDHTLRVLAMVYDDHADWRPEWTVLESVDDSTISRERNA
jgi:hypothetical protein